MTVPNDPKVTRPTGDAGRQSGRDRRVRFAASNDVREICAIEEGGGHAERRRHTILPGEDEGRARRAQAEDKQPIPESEGPIRGLDPVLAATRRARFRAEASRMQLAEDASMPDDLAAAEEEYDEPEELYNEGGIPIEPFHLRAEREAGYFDAEGNYLEYRLDAEDTDAWLESIMDEHRQVRADPDLVAWRRRAVAAASTAAGAGATRGATAGAAAGGGDGSGIKAKGRCKLHGGETATGADEDENADDDDEDEGPYDMHMLDDTGAVLGEDERALYQKRVADLLQPGETPLDGLRRLGKVMHGADTSAATVATATAPGSVAAAAAAPGAGKNDGEKAALEAAAFGAGTGDAGAHQSCSKEAAVVAGHGGGGVGSGGGGAVAVAVPQPHELSCGERQRLRKQRREHQGAEAVAPAPSSLPQGLPAAAAQPEGKRPAVAMAAAVLGQERERQEGRQQQQQQQQPMQGEEEAAADEGGESLGGGGGDVAMRDDVAAAAGGPGPGAGVDVETEADAAPEAVNAEGGPRPGDAPPSPPARQSTAAAVAAAAARRRPPAGQPSPAALEARRQFDALTNYANLLLSAGVYDTYGSTREQLLRAAQRTLGVDVVRSLALVGQRPVGRPAAAAAAMAAAKPPGRGAADGGSGTSGKRRRQPDADAVAAARGTAAEAESADASRETTDASAAAMTPSWRTGAGGGAVAVPVDADVDMFGDQEDDTAGGGGDGGTEAAGPRPQEPPTSGPQTDRDAAVAGCPDTADEAGLGERSATAEGSGGDVAALAEAPAGLPSRGDFVLDPDSGYLYSSDLGYYYDSTTGLYGDASTGLWYRYVTGAAGGGDGGGGRSRLGEEVPQASGGFELVAAGEQPQEQPQPGHAQQTAQRQRGAGGAERLQGGANAAAAAAVQD